MSKPFPGDLPPVLDPEEQLQYLVAHYRNAVRPSVMARLKASTRALGLRFTDDELVVIAALDTPARVQEFLDTELHYNNDHASVELEETAMPPRQVLRSGMAHCFEGAMFAYAVNHLHGFAPRLSLLEATQDSEHNLVIVRDRHGGWFGCNAHSRYPHLDGRPMRFETMRELALSYAPWYYSDRTRNPKDVTLVGYSDPFDLVARFGVGWMAADEPLWRIYYTYIDETVTFRYLSGDEASTHLYPLVKALKHQWIQVDARGTPLVNVSALPPNVQELWRQFWELGEPTELPVQGPARALEQEFFRLTGTTPIDLRDNAYDLQFSLQAGYWPDHLSRAAE